jgi:hypothetical protein
MKQLEEDNQKLLDQISYVGTKNYQRKLERTKEIAEACKLQQDYAELRKKAEHNEDVGNRAKKMLAEIIERREKEEKKDKEAQQRGEQLLQSLRDMKDARRARDAALLENQNLKRKCEGSTSPPPPQIKLLLTRSQGTTLDQQLAPSPTGQSLPR